MRFKYDQFEEKIHWYDYGARFYDPVLGRFTTQDPLASDFVSWTPYHYVHNNPIMLVDPTGMAADWFENELTGEIMNVKGESTIPATEEAKGYVRMGDDDMFGQENIPSGREGTVTRYNAEESTEFMSEQGYSFETKEANVVDVVDQQYHAEGDGLIVLEVEVSSTVTPLTGTYVKDSHVQTGYTDSNAVTRSVPNIKTTTVRETKYAKRTYEYGPKAVNAGKDAGRFGKQVIPWGEVGEKIQRFFKKL